MAHAMEPNEGLTQTCPRRMGELGPWKREPGRDEWRKVGDDRVCSFCGSMHPDDFLAVLHRAADPEDSTRIDWADGCRKVYVHREEVPNASHGSIKFYIKHWLGTGHVDDKGNMSEELGRALRAAEKESEKKFKEFLAEQRRRMFERHGIEPEEKESPSTDGVGRVSPKEGDPE